MAFWWQKTDVTLIKNTPAGLIFAVRHGKGLLREKWGPGLCALTWQGVPLINLWPDECPTCAGMVSAGFGSDSEGAARFISAMNQWNQPFQDLPTTFSHLEPLLTLLPSGYYTLEDRELYPVDGNGHFFWSVGTQKSKNPATASVVDEIDQERYYYTPGPLYLLPTQSPAHFNPERAAFYRDKPDTRAIAWYFNDSYLCALLDGHHKACAAALEKRPVKSLVIAPVKHAFSDSLTFGNGEKFTKKEFIKGIPRHTKSERLSPEYSQACITPDVRDTFIWPDELIQSVSAFPGVEAASTLLEAGDLSEKRINGIIEGGVQVDYEDLPVIMQALFYTHSPLFIPFACFICREQYCSSYRYLAFSLLAQTPCQPVEDFFLDFLINDDGTRPDFTRIVDDYFRQR